MANYLDSLLDRIEDEPLRENLAREIASLRKRKHYGLVFERKSETARLYGQPVAVGSKVQEREEAEGPLWIVRELANGQATVERRTGDETAVDVLAVDDLVVVREFGEAIYPGLMSLGLTQRGGEDRPFHTVIEAENYHALEALLYTHASGIDVIYIDPPSNTGKKTEWKYNDRFVDEHDDFRHSKWKTAERTELRELLSYCAAEAKRRDISVLVVYKVDRLARHVPDHVEIKASLFNHGVIVRAVAESFDDTPIGNYIETLMAANAQLDNELRRERTIDGMKEALRRGRWVWRAPLGYLRTAGDVPRSMVADPEVAPLIRHGFEALASRRLTKIEALDELTDLGLVNRRGKPLSPQAFGEMLRKVIYTGRIVKPEWDIDAEGDFDAIIESDLFQAVQDVLDGRAGTRASRVRDNPDFPLRRVVRCGQCSSPLTGSWSTGRSRRRYPYYRCPQKGCRGTNVRKEQLEELLVEVLDEMSLRPEMLDLLGAVVEGAWKERVRTAKAAEKALGSRLSDVERRIAALTDAWLDGRGVDDSTYQEQKQRLTSDAVELRNRLASATPTEANLARAIDLAQAMLVDLPRCWNRLDPQHRPHFVAALHPAGLIYEGGCIGTVEIPWWMATSEGSTRANDGSAPPTGFEPVLPA